MIKFLTSQKLVFLVYTIISIIVYLFGRHSGKESILLEWEQDKLRQQTYISQLQDEFAQQINHYQQEQLRIVNEFNKAKINYSKNIASIRSSYDYELLKSNERANLYKRQSEGGLSSCANLADITARFDSTLTEGISLVKELTTTLELRDATIKELGNHLENERQLFQTK